jgi:hypothetical protein
MEWKHPKERVLVLIAFVVIAACIGLKLELPAEAPNLTSSSVPADYEVLAASIPEYTFVNMSIAESGEILSACYVLDSRDVRFVNFTLRVRDDLSAHHVRMGNYSRMNLFPEMEVEVDNFYRYLERSLDELSSIEVSPQFIPLKNEEEQALRDAKRYEFFMLTAIRAEETKQFSDYYEQLERANQYSEESSGHFTCLAGMYQKVTGSAL